jgi:ribosomal protein S18 acetylase RimI-like enzyme
VDSTIEPFISSEQGALIRAIDAVCSEELWMSTPRFEPTPTWIHAFETPACQNHRLLVARDGQRILGWCRAFPLSDDSRAEVGIGLLPEHRGLGLGRMLLNQVLDWAVKKELEQVVLSTRVDNARAIHLFESCGFTAQGHRTDGWLDMACHLLPAGGYANGR